jgi:hypothetical protein
VVGITQTYICTQPVAGGHYTNILMQVERYPKGEEVLYERSRKLRWHSAPPRGVLLSPSLHLSPPSRRKHVLLGDSQRSCLFLFWETIENMFWYASFKHMYVYHLYQYFSARDYKLKLKHVSYQKPSLCAHKVRVQQQIFTGDFRVSMTSPRSASVTSTSSPCSDSELLH